MDQPSQDASCPLFDRYIKELGCYTVCFFKREGSRAKPFGSGVLLRIGEVHLVATARHVIDDAIDQERWPYIEGVPIFIGTGERLQNEISVGGHVAHRLAENPYDSALIELNGDDVELLSRRYRFLEMRSCDLRPLEPDDAYLVLGFPAVDAIVDEEAHATVVTSHGYFTSPYQGERGPVPIGTYFNPEVNVVFDHMPTDFQNYEGPPTGFPSKGGASGCGIWRLNVKGKTPEQWDPADACLVAIYHSPHEATQTSIGTGFGYLLKALMQNRPELKSAINAWFPGG